MILICGVEVAKVEGLGNSSQPTITGTTISIDAAERFSAIRGVLFVGCHIEVVEPWPHDEVIFWGCTFIDCKFSPPARELFERGLMNFCNVQNFESNGAA